MLIISCKCISKDRSVLENITCKILPASVVLYGQQFLLDATLDLDFYICEGEKV